MKHKGKPIYGVQAHIERATSVHPAGWQILENFISNVVEKTPNSTLLKLPSPKRFRKKVEENEEEYGISDCIYNWSIKELSRIKLSQLNDRHEIRIIRPFLLTWGVMGRVLGHAGVEAIRKKLKDINKKIEPFRSKDISTANLDKIKDSIIELFDEIRETEFKSKKGKQKEVGSTAASKVLHLTCPNLFVMWDSAIRAGYKKKNGDGEDYFNFLNEMKSTAKGLDTTIKDLQQKYGKRVTRILDQYNWIKFKNDPKKPVFNCV